MPFVYADGSGALRDSSSNALVARPGRWRTGTLGSGRAPGVFGRKAKEPVMAAMRAKMVLRKIERDSGGETWEFGCVTDAPYDPEGISDDNRFSRFSPSGTLTLRCTNPALMGAFNPGEKYYLDFTKAET